MEKICPEILIISNKHDYSTDHVTFQLHENSANYLRLNRDQFLDYNISLNPTNQMLFGETNEFSFEITSKSLKSIYFRAPVYLRDNYQPNLSPNEQLSRSQWAAFIRSLIIFDDVLWVNHPQATYKAEIKPYQLYIAKKIGFKVPNTLVTNTVLNHSIDDNKKYIIKTLDPVILKMGDKEAFIYTNTVNYDELLIEELSNAPFILQEALIPKIDVRVTVIDNIVFAVDIKKNDEGINRDWRVEKENVQYTKINLPQDIEEKCVKLIKELKLNFGAIDLAIYNGKYYFIEINPTGEWAWLMEQTQMRIDCEIANLLSEGNHNYVKNN